MPRTRRAAPLLDRCLVEIDTALRVLGAPARAGRRPPSGGHDVADGPADATDRSLSAALMRVNHAGEIAAQALYRGQALVAKSDSLRDALLRAADDEQDHLAWCAERVADLGQRTSRLAPVWYLGSFAIGTAAGLAGDRYSLGFIAETERQVAGHLDGHLERLPLDDAASRRIVRQMRADEVEHGLNATRRGAQDLPRPVRSAMRLASRVMTTLAYRL